MNQDKRGYHLKGLRLKKHTYLDYVLYGISKDWLILLNGTSRLENHLFKKNETITCAKNRAWIKIQKCLYFLLIQFCGNSIRPLWLQTTQY